MPTTTKWSINYPAGTEASDLPAIIEATAQSVDNALEELAGQIPWTPLTLVNGYVPLGSPFNRTNPSLFRLASTVGP